MATPDKKLADVEKTSSRSPSVVADETYIDPKGSETLHRGLNARQVRLAQASIGHLAHTMLTLAPDFHDFPRRRCWNRSHYWIRNSTRSVSPLSAQLISAVILGITFTSIQTPIL